MTGEPSSNIDRRQLLTRTVPACAIACLGLGRLPEIPMPGEESRQQGQHKFDEPRDLRVSFREQIRVRHQELINFIKALQTELDETELIRLLNVKSMEDGRMAGERQARNAADTSFATFVSKFRPEADLFTHEVVEDSEKVFGIKVTECLVAETYQAAGLGGEIGHAAVCNMDYYWPPAFNPNFRMERTKTLMQGHDQCNHRYLDVG